MGTWGWGGGGGNSNQSGGAKPGLSSALVGLLWLGVHYPVTKYCMKCMNLIYLRTCHFVGFDHIKR